MRFWDFPSLIPLFVREAHSPILEALAADDPDMMLWWTSPVECGSAVHRLRREGVFTPAEAALELPCCRSSRTHSSPSRYPAQFCRVATSKAASG
jgi:hypothetical protein